MGGDLTPDAVYSMGVMERMTGLTARQLRYWEQHGLISPVRSKGRHRLYTEADIVRLKEIKRLVGEGMTMEQVKAHLEKRRTPPSSSLSAKERLVERIPTHLSGPGRSLYTGASRAEVQRLIDRRPQS